MQNDEPLTNHRLTEDHTPSSMLAVIVLALAAFIFNTTEFIPIALLSDIGASFGMNAGQTGVMMTVYAWVVAVMSLPMMLITAKMERKKLLLVLFLLFVPGSWLVFLGEQFWVFVGLPSVGGVCSCVFLVHHLKSCRASCSQRQTNLRFGADCYRLSLGDRTGFAAWTAVGAAFGRRTSFGVIGLIGVFVMGCLFVLLPKLAAKNAGSAASLPMLAKNTPLLIIYAMVVLMVSAHFTVYSYIEPFVLKVSDFGADFATMVLLIFGVAGLVGSWLFGRFYDRLGDAFVMTSFVVMVLCLGLLYGLLDYQWLWVGVVFCWGVAMTCLALALQMRVLKLAQSYTDVAMSLFSGIFNVGIGAGAMMGGMVIASALGLSAIGYVGAVILLFAVAVFAWSLCRQKRL